MATIFEYLAFEERQLRQRKQCEAYEEVYLVSLYNHNRDGHDNNIGGHGKMDKSFTLKNISDMTVTSNGQLNAATDDMECPYIISGENETKDGELLKPGHQLTQDGHSGTLSASEMGYLITEARQMWEHKQHLEAEESYYVKLYDQQMPRDKDKGRFPLTGDSFDTAPKFDKVKVVALEKETEAAFYDRITRIAQEMSDQILLAAIDSETNLYEEELDGSMMKIIQGNQEDMKMDPKTDNDICILNLEAIAQQMSSEIIADALELDEDLDTEELDRCKPAIKEEHIDPSIVHEEEESDTGSMSLDTEKEIQLHVHKFDSLTEKKVDQATPDKVLCAMISGASMPSDKESISEHDQEHAEINENSNFQTEEGCFSEHTVLYKGNECLDVNSPSKANQKLLASNEDADDVIQGTKAIQATVQCANAQQQTKNEKSNNSTGVQVAAEILSTSQQTEPKDEVVTTETQCSPDMCHINLQTQHSEMIEKSMQTSVPVEESYMQTEEAAREALTVQTELSLPISSLSGDSVSLAGGDFSLEMIQEKSLRIAAEQLANLLQGENKQLAERLKDEMKSRMLIENSVSEIKANRKYDERMHEEFKYRCETLEAELKAKDTQLSETEAKLEEATKIKSGLDLMIDARYAETKAAQMEAQLKASEQEVSYYKAEADSLKEQLTKAIQDRQEMISLEMHYKLLAVSDERARIAEHALMDMKLQMTELKHQLSQQQSSLKAAQALTLGKPSLPEPRPSAVQPHTVELPDVTVLESTTDHSISHKPAQPPIMKVSRQSSLSDDWSSSDEEDAPAVTMATHSPERSMTVASIAKSINQPVTSANPEPISPKKPTASAKPPVAAKPKLAPKPSKLPPKPAAPTKPVVLSTKPAILAPKPNILHPKPSLSHREEQLVLHEAPVCFSQETHKIEKPAVVRTRGPQGRRLPSRPSNRDRPEES